MSYVNAEPDDTKLASDPPYTEQNPYTIHLADGVRSRKTSLTYVVEVLTASGAWVNLSSTTSSEIYLSDVISIHGDSPSLDQVPLAGYAVGTLFVVIDKSSGQPQRQSWLVQAGAADPDDPGQFDPPDYAVDASHNKHLTKVQ